jgi:UDP-glucose 4-epimerase
MSRSGFAGRREAYYAPVRSVVTGGAGSIGPNLVHAPLDEGDEVLVVDTCPRVARST